MYICKHCNNEFIQKDDYNSHQCIWYCEYCCSTFTSKQNFKNHQTTSRHIKNVNNINDLQCSHCSKIFSSKQSRNVHILKCKLNKMQNANITNNITNNDNSVTNNLNNCSITNNITNNIVIYGNEDFSYIDKNAIQDALRTKNVLPRLCRLMRRNPNHPENRNIKVTDFSRGKTRIFTQRGWEPAQPIDTFNNMITEASEMLDNKTYEEKNKYDDSDISKVGELTDKVHELDMAQWQGKDTRWGQENRRAIMLEFVE